MEQSGLIFVSFLLYVLYVLLPVIPAVVIFKLFPKTSLALSALREPSHGAAGFRSLQPTSALLTARAAATKAALAQRRRPFGWYGPVQRDDDIVSALQNCNRFVMPAGVREHLSRDASGYQLNGELQTLILGHGAFRCPGSC